MDGKNTKPMCVNHPLAQADYNSIFAGGQPLCFNCATAESDTVLYSSASNG